MYLIPSLQSLNKKASHQRICIRDVIHLSNLLSFRSYLRAYLREPELYGFFFFFFTWKSKISVIRERKLIYIAELSESSLVNSIRYFPASNHYHRSVNHTFVFVCDERIIRLYRESVGISRKKSVYLLSIDNLRPHFVLFTSWRKSAPITLYNLHDCCISHI